MNFNKRVNGSWVDTPNYIHKTDTDTFTTLPAVLYPNDTTATVGLKGNEQHTGTPTPDNPIMPQGTGERTGNLWNNGDTWENNGTDTRTFFQPDIALFDGNTKVGDNARIDVKSNGYKYLVSITPNTSFTRVSVKHNGSTKDLSIGSVYGEFEANVPVTVSFIVNGFDPTTIGGISISNIMLNAGSTALPYEPYGQYKIPISSANTTTPVYLGEVQTTRKVKKVVLTGEEDWENSVNPTLFGVIRLLDLEPFIPQVTAYCSHYIYNPIQSGLAANMVNGEFALQKSSNAFNLYIRNTDYTTRSNFKDYLRQQYANGTPVTIWYVLATPTTGVVNEPLRKIGDYADTVSGITIPVTAGGDSVDIETTVKPSEVSLTYTGWHDTQCKEYDGSQWV